ncbi:MAG TPA: GerMN domain-containing protein [Bacillota bacterium]|jgi:germination protein M|nr:GerMN domain-containing protein [Bacillota bacterium]HPZ65316.1 GerMN domain-containing protein [Bacillota bacterium]HQD06308.1 GerMN domain-containing protein [Bacillota bacterium]
MGLGDRRLKAVKGVFALLLAAVLATGLAGCDLFARGDQGSPVDPAELRFPEPPPLARPGDAVRLGRLYYPDSQWRFLVPVQREIPYQEAIARVTLQQLIPDSTLQESLQRYGLAFPLPAQTEVRGINIRDGLARVDLNEIFLDYPAERERLVLGSLLCTLRQFPTVEQVEIVVQGEYVKEFPGGTPGRLPLGPECWINLEVESELEDYRNFTALELYYCYLAPAGVIFYVPVTRIIPATEKVVEALLEELLEGPPRESGLFSEIPAGTTVRGVSLEEGLLKVDFSRELLEYQGGKTGAENLVNQILLTLGTLEEVEQVQILVEGEAPQLKDGVDLTRPLEPPAVYNYF